MAAHEPVTKIVRSLRNGQITIPIEFRRELGIEADTLVQLTLENGELRLVPVRATRARGSAWLRDLYELFAPVREDAAAYTEDEVNAAIDEAVNAVRSKRD